jgi:hypothetical protein
MSCKHENIEFENQEWPYIGECPENCMTTVITYVCKDCNATGRTSYVDHHPMCKFHDSKGIIVWEVEE